MYYKIIILFCRSNGLVAKKKEHMLVLMYHCSRCSIIERPTVKKRIFKKYEERSKISIDPRRVYESHVDLSKWILNDYNWSFYSRWDLSWRWRIDHLAVCLQHPVADSETYRVVVQLPRTYSRYETRVNSIRE